MVGDARDAAWYQELIASGSDVAAMRGRLVFGRALAQAA
jgi:NAD(P)H-nitrite reductase large subunit